MRNFTSSTPPPAGLVLPPRDNWPIQSELAGTLEREGTVGGVGWFPLRGYFHFGFLGGWELGSWEERMFSSADDDYRSPPRRL